MTDWLEVRAGQQAFEHIRERGLQQRDVQLLMGASGGPKWFILQRLDKFLFGEFFADREQPLDLLGTSAGAWRFASLGQSDPVAASELFANLYSRQTYSAKPDVEEITNEAKKLLHTYIPDAALPHILEQDKFRHHFIAVRCKGLAARDSKLQALGLLGSALGNSLSRKWLARRFERVIFHHPKSPLRFSQHWQEFKTQHVPLQASSFKPALLATGSIPMVLAGVRDIPGAPPGVYRDGGITDYHFDVNLNSVGGLVLYPHFHRDITPGWFDKRLPWRRTKPNHWPNVVLLTPTPEFIASLPFGKIPDRKDFVTLSASERIRYWQTAIESGQKMADQFHEWLQSGAIRDKVKRWV